jgi:hypothetical protein
MGSFVRAVKQQLKAKVCLSGGSGSGKTYSALRLATGLAGGGGIAVIDAENRSAELFANIFKFDRSGLSAPFTPEAYISLIEEAENDGYAVLIIDSISHEWNGVGGCLEIKDKLGGGFADWARITPRHNKFISTILNSGMHVISTVRTKVGYSMGDNGEGKQVVRKVGLQPITREGFDYENTVVFDLNANHIASSCKDRTTLFDGKDFVITENTGAELLDWLNDGERVPTKAELTANVCRYLDGAVSLGDLSERWAAKQRDIKGLGGHFLAKVSETKDRLKKRLELKGSAATQGDGEKPEGGDSVSVNRAGGVNKNLTEKDLRIEMILRGLSGIQSRDADFTRQARETIFAYSDLATSDIPDFLEYCFGLGGKNENTLRAIVADLTGSVFDWIHNKAKAERSEGEAVNNGSDA